MKRFSILPLILFAFSSAHYAAAGNLEKFKVLELKASGSSRYTAEEIIRASKLSLHSTVTQQDLQDASSRLGSSGVFSAVRFSYMPVIGGVSVSFQVTDAPNMLPATFENFVWFTPEDLLRQLQEQAPLFHGLLPEAGSLQDEVIASLQQMLSQKGIQGRARSEAQQARLGAPITAIAFKVDLPIRIASVRFSGASSSFAAKLQQQAQPLLQAPYARSFVRGFCESTLKRLYLAEGYLKTEFGEPATQVVGNDLSAPAVSLLIPITEGPQYRFAGADFSGNNVVSLSDLQKLVVLKVDDPADAIKFAQALAALKVPYGARGYLGVSYRIQAQLLAGNTARFEVQLHEGDQYKLGKFEITGEDPAATAKLMELWKMPSEAIYDDNYKLQYMVSVRNRLASLPPYRFVEKINDENKTVDLILEFNPHS